MGIVSPVGTPGYKTPRTATFNDPVVLDGSERHAVGYRVLDGVRSGDPLQSPTSVVGGGRPLGRITSGGKYRPWYVGLTNAAASSGATSITVTAAVATEMARLIAAGGTQSVVFIGPPSAAGTVAVLAAVNCTAASSTTLTVAAIGANLASGSLICINDGSQTVRGLQADGWGLDCLDEDGARIDAQLRLLIGGHVDPTRIPDYSSMDTSVQTYLKTQLKTVGPFTFTDDAA